MNAEYTVWESGAIARRVGRAGARPTKPASGGPRSRSTHPTDDHSMNTHADYFRGLQDRICAGLESIAGSRFREDAWQREGGGGGRTRVLIDGAVFEKAGVNFSQVHGQLSEEFARQIPGEGRDFTATGISLVLHPRNPMAPT